MSPNEGRRKLWERDAADPEAEEDSDITGGLISARLGPNVTTEQRGRFKGSGEEGFITAGPPLPEHMSSQQGARERPLPFEAPDGGLGASEAARSRGDVRQRRRHRL